MLSPRRALATVTLLTVAPAVFAAPPDASAPKAPLFAATTIQVTEVISAPGPDGKLASVARLNIAYTAPVQVRIDEYQAVPTGGFSTTPDAIFVDDGKTLYQYQAAHKQYIKQTGDDAADFPLSVSGEFTSDLGTVSGTEKLDGQSLMVYTLTTPDDSGRIVTTKTWVNPMTQLFYRRVNSMTQDKKITISSQIDYHDWVLNKPIDAAKFTWTPPAGVTEYIPPQLLADGTTAPDFTVQDKDGKPVKLSDYAGKVVVLDFWATWAGQSIASMPHTNTIAKKFADQGVVVLAVSVSDTKDAFEKWLPLHPEYSSIHFAIDPAVSGKDVGTLLYNVTEFPTQYVVGKDGKISHHMVGDEPLSPELEAAIRKALSP